MSKNERKDGAEVQDAIIIEDPEVINGDVFSGEIVTVGVGFIFINNVKRGYETIGTNGDVFCPVPQDSVFETGQLVQFSELNPDQTRHGKLRTETVSLVGSDANLAVQDEKVKVVYQLAKTTSPYHQLKKIIEEGDIKKAGKNGPLVEFAQQIYWVLNQEGGYNPENINKLVEEFIQKTFAMLAPLGVKCSIMDDVDTETEKKVVDETIEMYRENNLAGQVESLEKEYSQFLKVRKAFTLMHNYNLLNYSSVIDVKYLPELAFAYPVWFVSAKKPLRDSTRENDPNPDHAIEFFADSVGSREFAWFYQMYNRRTRPMSQFSGKDIMPPNLVRTMKEAKELFDYVAILTPYHDVASKEWSDPSWLRNIDPLLVGFLKGLPHLFVLGRWSGTGIFPMIFDCVADTANHIRLNKHLLENFPAESYWYKGLKGNETMLATNKEVLPKFADKLLLAYDRGVVFQFLRGELAGDTEYSFF